MQRSLFTIFLLLMTAVTVSRAQDRIPVTQTDINALYTAVNRGRVSVHDPSVVHQSGQTFYAFGSHRAVGVSSDNMQNWTGVNNSGLFGKMVNGKATVCSFNDAFLVNETQRVTILKNGTPTEVDFGSYNACEWAKADDASWILGDEWGGNMWAPDVLWNPTMQKWCMYLSINGENWHSVIILLTADKITGPYVYQGPVHFSGFRNMTIPEINWKKTDLELVIGEQATLPGRYNKGNNWPQYWTNDIDPCVFYDEEEQLWMVYGSWFGGIFILKLDNQTGLRDYTATYPIENDGQGRALSDPYFGKRIAGGYWSSGEGPYIKHIGNYYYLFLSYGGFAPDGGYEMRVFRSEKADGLYLDATNHDACYHDRYWLNYGPKAETDGGMKLLGAYNGWGFQTVGECAQGHNSVAVDAKGRSFVVYHTKFNDGTIAHQVRTRQLFLNEDGWLCAAPFEFDGETDTDATLAAGCRYTKDELVGTYDVLIHKYRMDYEHFEEVTPIQLTLNANGTVSGALSGSWTLTDGTAYITLTAGSVTYKGVVVQQQVDGYKLKAIGITATAASGVSLWAWKMEPQSAIAYTYKNYTMPVKNNESIVKHLPLAVDGAYGATISWESSNPEVISAAGQYNPTGEDTSVQLTCHITAGNYTYDQTFNVTAVRASVPAGDPLSGIVAYYDFEGKSPKNLYNTSQSAYLTKQSTTSAAATLVADANRYGQVVKQAASGVKQNSYTRIANPLKDAENVEGFTIAAWVYREDGADLTGTLWGLTDKLATLATVSQRLFLTANASIHFEDGTNSFDINALDEDGSNATHFIPAGQWAFVVLTVSATDGVTLYVNGSKKIHKTFTSTAGTASTASAAAKLFDYHHVMNMVAGASYLQLGHGDAAHGSAAARFDDLFIFSRAFTSSDVKGLNTLVNRTTDFSPEAVGIEAMYDGRSSMYDVQWDGAIFDLSGRPVHRPSVLSTLSKGLYIVNGSKVLVK